MSRTSRWILGSFSLLFAWTFAISAQNATRPLFVWICAGFCLLISLACFSNVARDPAIRVIGATVFGVYAFYLTTEVSKVLRNPSSGSFRRNWSGALEGLLTFGLPGLYVALRGRYPAWGKGASAFLGENHQRPGTDAGNSEE